VVDDFTHIYHLEGGRYHWGDREYFKRIKADIGRTKPSRSPQKQGQTTKYFNDGRAPDTAKQLVGPQKKTQALTKKSKTAGGDPANPKGKKSDFIPQDSLQVGFPWAKNSCWLDSPLQVLYAATLHEEEAYTEYFADVDPKSSFLFFKKTVESHTFDPMKATARGILSNMTKTRNAMRSNLSAVEALRNKEFEYHDCVVC
jgi:hypothetical protein